MREEGVPSTSSRHNPPENAESADLTALSFVGRAAILRADGQKNENPRRTLNQHIHIPRHIMNRVREPIKVSYLRLRNYLLVSE